MKSRTELYKTYLQKTWVRWLLISVLTVLIYSETTSYGMLYNFDDDAYFSDKRISELNVGHVKEYFTDYYLGMYQPLPVLSFAVIDHLFPGSLQAQRLFNILLHSINILLVLLVIKKLTGNQYVSAFTALFFAIHPMHIESVTWISTRSNLMFSTFYLGSLFAFLHLNKNRVALKWTIILSCFAFALLSKVTAVTLPGTLLLVHWYQGRKFNTYSIFQYLPFFILSGIFIWTGIQASTAFGHITEMGQNYTFLQRFVLFFHALWLYLYKFFIPVNQSVIYLFPFLENGELSASCLISAILALVVSSAVLLIGFKMHKHQSAKDILFGFMFFLITISVAMPLKWSRTIIIAERYTYLPYIGLSVGVLLLLFGLTTQNKKYRLILTSALLLLTTLFSVQSFQRNKVWENPITLFSDVVDKKIGKAETAMAFYNRGNEYLRLKNAELAISDYSSAIKFYASYHEAYYNRGLVYYFLGDNPSAIKDFSATIEIKNDFVDAFINRGAAHRNTGLYELALSDLDKAISLRPSELAYLSRGVLYYSNLNQPEMACSDWTLAAQLGSQQAKDLLQQYCFGQ
ncbi:MAG: tetratricopeptide repeat protein [Bacteroidales bacterium]